MQPKDYYKILGVSEDSSEAEIKKAFRKIARDSHPDRNPGDAAAEERFKEAGEAYEVLSNPEKRSKFDALRKYGFDQAGFGPGGFRPGSGFPGGTHVHFEGGDIRDFDFADIFSEGSPFSGVFDQIFQQMGAQGGGTYTRRAHSNRRPPDPLAGDDFFRRDGLDVHCTVRLAPDLLKKGTRFKVRTPSGKKAMVRIPPRTRSGIVLRLPGFGLNQGPQKGDQFVHVEAADEP